MAHNGRRDLRLGDSMRTVTVRDPGDGVKKEQGNLKTDNVVRRDV
jgi:hypothetical protein